MDIDLVTGGDAPLERVYIATAILKNFRGHRNVEAHLFRPCNDTGVIAELRGKGLVEAPNPAIPPQVMAGATEDAALKCILESFTLKEARQLADYLGERYADQINKLSIAPITLPVPFGIGPLGEIPEVGSSGFIYFDHAKDYPLNFPLRGYYDLSQEAQA